MATYIAQGYWVEGENPAIAHAQSIAFDDLEKALLGEKSREPVMPEPKAGSYERMLQMFNGM